MVATLSNPEYQFVSRICENGVANFTTLISRTSTTLLEASVALYSGAVTKENCDKRFQTRSTIAL